PPPPPPAPLLAVSADAGGALTQRRRVGASALALAAACACGQLAPDFDHIVALEVILPDSGLVEVNDTLVPGARALNGRGESVAATIRWEALDTAIVALLDTTTGESLGKTVGTGRLQARVGRLRTNPLGVTVQAPADSAFPEGPTRDTVTVSTPDSLSDSLRVKLTATPSTQPNLVRRRVVLESTTYPAGAAAFTLVPNDTVFTGTGGVAVFRVRLTGGPLPDSILVIARAARANGTPVPGTPIPFVVEFRP
ncbi:MAG: hypothetical protein ACREL9_05140, partial [Gemmatimonadales bacterium]